MTDDTRSQYEIEIVHPAIAEWLDRHGWKFDQEVAISRASRLDFIARNANGQTLIVEGKTDCSSFGKTIKQLLRYEKEYGKPAHLAIAVPLHTINDKAIKDCNRLQIQLIGLDVPPPKPVYDERLNDACKELIAYVGEWGNKEYAIHINRILISLNVPAANEYIDRRISMLSDQDIFETIISFAQKQGKELRFIIVKDDGTKIQGNSKDVILPPGRN